jgi:hypothetical protein
LKFCYKLRADINGCFRYEELATKYHFIKEPVAFERRKSTGLITKMWNTNKDDKLECRFVGGQIEKPQARSNETGKKKRIGRGCGYFTLRTRRRTRGDVGTE